MRIAEATWVGGAWILKPLLGVNNSGVAIQAAEILSMAPLKELIEKGWVEVVNEVH